MYRILLTHRDRDKMAAFQTTFWNLFFSGPIFNKPALVQVIALNKDCLDYWHMYASLSLDGFSNTDGEEIVDYCPILLTRLTSMPVWINKHIPNKVWDIIIYPFPNFNDATKPLNFGNR